MSRLRRVYLPRWMGWFVTALVVPVWLLLSWATFYPEFPEDRVPLPAYLLATLILAIVVAVIWLMATQRLPAYLIELEPEEGPGPPGPGAGPAGPAGPAATPGP